MQPSLHSYDASPATPAYGRARGLRALLSPIMRRFDVTLKIRHPVTGLRFRLRSLTHRRFWLLRSRQQNAVMARCIALSQRADTALDVGGGIGFMAQVFAQRLGGDGQVHVFEPCPANQSLLAQNIQSFANASVINAAVSDRIGKTPIATTCGAGVTSPRLVHTVTLDSYTTQHGLRPEVLRIAVGANALSVLQGGRKTLARARAVVVDVTTDQTVIFGLLETAGYDLTDAFGTPLADPSQLVGPVFGTR